MSNILSEFRGNEEDRDATNLLSGKTICSVFKNPNSDEGLILHLSDGSLLEIGFSSCYGSIMYHYPKLVKLS